MSITSSRCAGNGRPAERLVLGGSPAVCCDPSGKSAAASAAEDADGQHHTASFTSAEAVHDPQWMENLGNRFDADSGCGISSSGATHLCSTTSGSTAGVPRHEDDEVQDAARLCTASWRRLPAQPAAAGAILNAMSDGNPELDQWATLDKQGKPIVFGARWPTRYRPALAVPAEGGRAGARVVDGLRPPARHLARHLQRAAEYVQPVGCQGVRADVRRAV